jgi:hypothetical protein
MEQQALPGSAALNGHPQSGNGRAGRFHTAAEGPVNNLPVKQVRHRRQVYPPAPYVPLSIKIFRKTRPFPPTRSPIVLVNAGFAASG